jgi:hypothetical protein
LTDPITTQFGIVALAVDGSQTGVVTAPDADDVFGDKDVFKVSLVGGQRYTIRAEGASVNGFDALPQVIFTVRDSLHFSTILATSSEGSSALLEFTPQNTGDYYIRIGAGGNNFATDQGGYILHTLHATQEDDPGNTLDTASDISLQIQNIGSYSYSGRAGGGDPADYFKVVAPAAGQLSI